MVSSTSVNNSWVIKGATTNKISTWTISKINRSNWIKASIVFGFHFCDHDLVTRLILSNKR